MGHTSEGGKKTRLLRVAPQRIKRAAPATHPSRIQAGCDMRKIHCHTDPCLNYIPPLSGLFSQFLSHQKD